MKRPNVDGDVDVDRHVDSRESRVAFWPGLDGLRGVAIASVVVFHTRAEWLPGGAAGVDIFFVLSGFLITLTLLPLLQAGRRGGFSVFYKRRALRILPAMLVAVPLGYVLTWFARPDVRGIIGSAAVSAIFFVANFRAANHPASMSVFLPHWSLALEEQFYLLWPPVLFVLLRRARLRPRAVVAVTAGLTGVALAWRAYNLHRVSLTAVLYRPDLRADPILLGCVAGLVVGLGLVPSAPWFRTAVRAVAVAGAVGVGIFMVRFEWFDGRGRLAVGLLGVAVASAALILERVAAPTRLFSFVLERPVLMWLGRISYCLYLVHVPVIVCTREFVTGTGADLFAIGLAVAAAVMLHRTIEAPFLALKRTIRLPEPTTEAQPS